jgi:shikimate kinase
MIIALNGYPGVGKLTIGSELAALIDGRMLDIHSVYNVAFALTEFKSPEFITTVEKIEAIAHDLIRKLPVEQPVVLTTVLAGADDCAIPPLRSGTKRAHSRCWVSARTTC